MKYEPLWLVEIDQPKCKRIYGECSAELGVTGVHKCFNTKATCQDRDNYDEETLTLRFGTQNAKYDDMYIMPFVNSVSTSPAQINPAGGSRDLSPLGKRAVVTVNFKDPPHSDFYVDPYVNERTYNPSEQSTFFRKWTVRNPYYRYTTIRVLSGNVGDAYSELTKREYLIDSIAIGQGNITMRGKDPLVLASNEQAQAPRATGGLLYDDLTGDEEYDEIKVFGTYEGEYPSSGTIRIGREVMTYASISYNGDEATFEDVERGTDGTLIAEHKINERVQLCLRITEEQVHDIIHMLLTVYGEMEEQYIPYQEWKDEVDNFLFVYVLSTLITEPTGISDLIGEILETSTSYLFWHEKERKLKYKAYRPSGVLPPVVSDRNDILADSLSVTDHPEMRLSQVWVFWNQFDPTERLDRETNYNRIRIRVLGDDDYKDRNIRKVFSRWIINDAQAIEVSIRLLARYEVPPKKVTCNLTKRDLWVSDFIRLDSNWFVNSLGLPQEIVCEVVSAEETKHYNRYQLQTFDYIKDPEIPVPEGMLVLSLAELAGFSLCDGTDDTLDLIGRYLKAWNEQGEEGGAETHIHDDSGFKEATLLSAHPSEDSGYGDSDGLSRRGLHSHNGDHTHPAESNKPLTRTVIPYDAKGLQRFFTATMLFFYDGDVIPLGWEVNIDFLDKYVKCDNKLPENEGAETHDHYQEAYTAWDTGVNGRDPSLTTGSIRWQRAGSDHPHRHSLAHGHTQSNDPEYHSLLPITIYDAETMPEGLCAFFIGTSVPEGWSVFSPAHGRFIKCKQIRGEQGGANEHEHVVGDNDPDEYSNPAEGTSSKQRVAGSALITMKRFHRHVFWHSHDTQPNEPPFRKLMFCRYDGGES